MYQEEVAKEDGFNLADAVTLMKNLGLDSINTSKELDGYRMYLTIEKIEEEEYLEEPVEH